MSRLISAIRRHPVLTLFLAVVLVGVVIAVRSQSSGSDPEQERIAQSLASPDGIRAAFAERGFDLRAVPPDALGPATAELAPATLLINFDPDGADASERLDSSGFLSVWVFPDEESRARAGLALAGQEQRIYERVNVLAAYREGIEDRGAQIETLLIPFAPNTGSGGE